MAKYSNDFKLKVVKFYLNNRGGYETTANYFNIPSFSTVRKWVKRYQKHSTKGLIRNQKTSYSGEFKQNVVEYMHSNHLSGLETAIHFNLANENVPNK